MVDYTKPQYRDESWKRWKGGDQLAKDLNAFYTNKRVFDRLGAQQPLASNAAITGKRGAVVDRLRAMHGAGRKNWDGGMRRSVRVALQQQREANAARQKPTVGGFA